MSDYAKMTDAELNAAEAAALVALRAIKAERKARKAPATKPAPALPVGEVSASYMRAHLSVCSTRQVAVVLLTGYCADYKITVAGLRALAAHWGITVWHRRKADIIGDMVEALVGRRLDSLAIDRAN